MAYACAAIPIHVSSFGDKGQVKPAATKWYLTSVKGARDKTGCLSYNPYKPMENEPSFHLLSHVLFHVEFRVNPKP